MHWLLHDARVPVQILGLMFGGLACLKVFFAMAAWRTDYPSKAGLLIGLWFAVACFRHSLVVVGVDWRDMVVLHWLQVVTMAGGCYGMFLVVSWKFGTIQKAHDLEMRITHLEDRVQEIVTKTGYKTDHGPNPPT